MSKSPLLPNDRDCWAAVESRDKEADGLFVFAVKSTKIYCRPSCPSRRPKPENVTFFALNDEAERAGYRACLRCKPKDMSLDQSHHVLIERLCRMIEKRLEDGEGVPRLDELAYVSGLSKFHLQRIFKSKMGMSPAVYGRAKADERLRAQLHEGGRVLDAVFEAGMTSPSSFYAHAQAALGMAPDCYRKGGEQQLMWFAHGQTTLGAMIIGGTAKGVSAIRFGDNPAALEAELRGLFKSATLIEASGAMEAEIEHILQFIEMPQGSLDLPLDIQGTVFQQKIWRALSGIGFGESCTYGQLADVAGMPKAVRAVANACGANPVAVVIPCHRVLRGDGSLGGYRWGEGRKKTLLAREGVHIKS